MNAKINHLMKAVMLCLLGLCAVACTTTVKHVDDVPKAESEQRRKPELLEAPEKPAASADELPEFTELPEEAPERPPETSDVSAPDASELTRQDDLPKEDKVRPVLPAPQEKTRTQETRKNDIESQNVAPKKNTDTSVDDYSLPIDPPPPRPPKEGSGQSEQRADEARENKEANAGSMSQEDARKLKPTPQTREDKPKPEKASQAVPQSGANAKTEHQKEKQKEKQASGGEEKLLEEKQTGQKKDDPTKDHHTKGKNNAVSSAGIKADDSDEKQSTRAHVPKPLEDANAHESEALSEQYLTHSPEAPAAQSVEKKVAEELIAPLETGEELTGSATVLIEESEPVSVEVRGAAERGLIGNDTITSEGVIIEGAGRNEIRDKLIIEGEPAPREQGGVKWNLQRPPTRARE